MPSPKQPLSSVQIARSLRPFYGPIGMVFETARRDVIASAAIIPNKRKTERANDMHAAIREGFRVMCDAFGDSFVILVEEPEGQGLDCLIVTLGDVEFALRWGKYDGVRIRRNSTERQCTAQEQYTLYGGLDRELDNLSVASAGYVVEDDHTEAGVPQWWIGKAALLRERFDSSEYIEDIVKYDRPVRSVEFEQNLKAPRVVARTAEYDALVRRSRSVRRKLA